MKTVISDNVLADAAALITALLARKKNAVIALEPVRELAGLMALVGESCSEARIFSVTDRAAELEAVLAGADIKKENVKLLSENELDAYDELIAEAGGLDLAVIGIGVNARIGFNEIATPFDSLTHSQKLTSRTKSELGIVGDDVRGLTMGIKTITQARSIIVAAIGAERSEAVYKMLYARTDSTVPAAFLQVPLNVTVICDGAAAGKL